MRSVRLILVLGASVPCAGAAQVPVERQIEWAVAAAPERMRAEAMVMGYDRDGRLVTLRPGNGQLICLGDNPAQPPHHVACYQKDLEPFMARGRELVAKGLGDRAVDSVRMAEIKSGKIRMPSQAAILYQLRAPPGSADPATGVVNGARSIFVIYLPYATAETTGLSTAPLGPGQPWLMEPGLPWAHVMIVQ